MTIYGKRSLANCLPISPISTGIPPVHGVTFLTITANGKNENGDTLVQ